LCLFLEKKRITINQGVTGKKRKATEGAEIAQPEETE